jgi:hypothetical protein
MPSGVVREFYFYTTHRAWVTFVRIIPVVAVAVAEVGRTRRITCSVHFLVLLMNSQDVDKMVISTNKAEIFSGHHH